MTDTVNPNDEANGTVSSGPTGETGIDITKQKIGTTIMVETEDDHLFEMVVKKPEQGVVEVTGTELRLKHPTLGCLAHSHTDDKKTLINHWIGQYLKMMLVFRNGNYESKPVTHVSLKGEGWKFDVF